MSEPVWVPLGATSVPVPQGALVTALPGSPLDGQEVIFVDSLSAPTYQWHLRYLAAKASNKWVFIGGMGAFSEITASETIYGGATYTDAPTPGPSLTAPVTGEYLLAFGCTGHPIDNIGERFMSPAFGATAPVDSDAAIGGEATGVVFSSMMTEIKRTVAAGTFIKMQYRQAAGNIHARRRWFHLTPVAVGG